MRRVRSFKGTAVAVAALTAVLGALVAAPSALAVKGFEAFKYCPFTNPKTLACLNATTESGEFTVGAKTVSVTNPITLQGGIGVNEETGAEYIIEATNGETLSKSPQTVPGGLLGIEGLGGEVTATTELAGPASNVTLNTENLIGEKGTALSLPVKLKLGNPFLGEHCHGGNNRHPIVLELTTGETSPPKPNKPIKGKSGSIGEEEEGEILVISRDSLVNNSFAAPGVEGCGLIPLLVDPLVDLAMGVPAPAGHNTAILNGTLRLSSPGTVSEHI